MRKLLLFISILFSVTLFSQVTPKASLSVSDSTKLFEVNIPIGNTLYNAGNQKYYICISGALSTENLVTASAKFLLINNGGDVKYDSLSWIHKLNKTYLRNPNDSVGVGTESPGARFAVMGSVAYPALFVDSTDIDSLGIRPDNLNRVVIYNDIYNAWSDWTSLKGSQLGAGTDGQLLTIASVGVGKLFLRNNSAQGDTIASFIMYEGDNITVQYLNNTWIELSRVEFHNEAYVNYLGAGGGGSFDSTRYKLKGDTLAGSGYYTNYKAISKWSKSDTTSTLETKAYNNSKLLLKRNLNNHDSLSTLDEKSYNSLTDKPTTWAISAITGLQDSLTDSWNKRDTATVLLNRARAASTYEPKIAAGTTGQYWRGDKTWQTMPEGAAYSAGYRLGLNGSVFFNSDYWKNQDTLNVSDGIVVATSKKITSITNNSVQWNNARAISNHDSLSTLDEKSYNSLTDKPTAWAISAITGLQDSLNDSWNKRDTGTVLLSRARATSTYEPKILAGTTGQYWRGDKTWQTLPEGTAYSAGFGLGLTGTVFYNSRYWKGQDTIKTTLTGLVKATSGVLSAITDNSTTWNNARAISNHDSLSTLDEKSYNSLTDKPSIPSPESTFGTVTSIATTSPVVGGTITSSGTIAIQTDTLYQWRLKQNKGSVAYGWGNHASAGYITDGNTGWDNSYGFITDGNTGWGNDYGFITGVSIATTSPVTGGTITNSGTISIISDTLTQWRTKQNKGAVAWGWGNHASAGYLTSQTSHSDVLVDGDFTSQGIMLRGASSGTYSILTDASTNWNTAYGWGNHASAGYITDGNTGWDNSYGFITDGNTGWDNSYSFITGVSIATTSPVTGGTITNSGTIAIIADTLTQWRTKQNKGSVAWGWGNHASAGYITDGNTGWDNSYGFITASSSETLSNKGGNISMWTNNSAYITDGNTNWGNDYGFITASSSETLSNKGGNISMWTNNSGYITDGNTGWGNDYGFITDGNTGWDNSYGFITGDAYVGTVTSIGTTSPLTGGTITSSGTIAIIADTLVQWRTKQNKGVVAYNWGNHASAGYITDGNTNWGNEYGFITASSSETLSNKGGNISMWTNNSGYITDGNTGWDNSYGLITDGNTGWDNSYGFITASSSETLSNKGGNISMWTNNSGYITDGNTGWGNDYGFITDGNVNWDNSYGYITGVSIATTSPVMGGTITNSGTVYIHADTLTSWRDKQNKGAVAYGWNNHASAGYITDGNTNWDNSYGFITDGNTNWGNDYGFITASSSETLTNKGGNISMWTNNSGYITDGNTGWDNSYSFITDGNTGWDNSYGLITDGNTGWDNSYGFITDGNTGWDNSYGFITASHSNIWSDITPNTRYDAQDDITTRTNSGFYQTSTGTTAEGWPITNDTFQHMLSVTHSNTENYYAMQIAGSFYDNVFYGRKTSGSGTTAWVKFWTSGNLDAGTQTGQINYWDGSKWTYSDTTYGKYTSAYFRSNKILSNWIQQTGTASPSYLFFTGSSVHLNSANGASNYAQSGGVHIWSCEGSAEVVLNNANLYPYANAGSSLGQSGNLWNKVFTKNIYVSSLSDETRADSLVCVVDGELKRTASPLNIIRPLFGTAIDSSLINTTMKFPIGYSNTIVVDSLFYIATTIGSGTVNVTPKIYWGPDIESTGTALITSPSAVTSHKGVTRISSFNNGTIPNGYMIWMVFTDVTTKPRNIMVQIVGH